MQPSGYVVGLAPASAPRAGSPTHPSAVGSMLLHEYLVCAGASHRLQAPANARVRAVKLLPSAGNLHELRRIRGGLAIIVSTAVVHHATPVRRSVRNRHRSELPRLHFSREPEVRRVTRRQEPEHANPNRHSAKTNRIVALDHTASMHHP